MSLQAGLAIRPEQDLATYVGRFAPSPTGPLHAGSLVAALASWLDARAHGGRWLVRIEDVDVLRCNPESEATILRQLHACGLVPDASPVRQSSRTALYAQALQTLQSRACVYPCACTRKDIEASLQTLGVPKPRHGELVYPGTCRDGLNGRPARAWRMRVEPGVLQWTDRRLGAQQQDVAREVGDFVLLRADGYFSYQLAVVVDDADQGITHVVRGEDLCDNTPRQILLQQVLGMPPLTYLHTPLVLGDNAEKLSKQNGALAVDTSEPVLALRALQSAAATLSLPTANAPPTMEQALAHWTSAWRARYVLHR